MPEESHPRKQEFRAYASFAEAQAAEWAYYRELSGDEKLQIMLEIMQPAFEANPHFVKAYRVVEGKKC